MERYPSIQPKTIESVVAPWLDTIRRQECGIVMFPPRGDAHRRIEYLLSSKRLLRKYLGRSYKKHMFVADSMFPHGEISSENLALHLLQLFGGKNTSLTEGAIPSFIAGTRKLLKKKATISFLLYDTDAWFRTGRTDLFTMLSKVAEKEPRIQFLLFCEIDITAPDLIKQNLGRTTLAQNVLTVPLYSNEDMKYFIESLESYWKQIIPSHIKDHIVSNVGPHTWLIKEAVRIQRRHSNENSGYHQLPTMRLRLETIWQQLTPAEQRVLMKIHTKEQILLGVEKHSLEHLKRIGFVTQDSQTPTITIPTLAEYIREKEQLRVLEVRNANELWLEDEQVNRFFGLHEQAAICHLIMHGNQHVSRDSLAQAIWKEKSLDSSDWALDRHISRIRSKLKKLGISPQKIETIKKVGFIWKQ